VDLTELVDAQCRAGRAGARALCWRGALAGRRDFSYGDLAGESDRYAGMLVAQGLKPGDTVGLMTGRRPETVMATLGIWKAGGVCCPLFVDLGPDPLAVRLAVGGVSMLIVDAHAYARAVAPIRATLPGLRHVIVLGTDPPYDPDAPVADLPAGAAGTAGVMHFTSGTTAPVTGGTAQPKAVVHDSAIVPVIAATAKAALTLGEGDLFWCTGEPGWVLHTAYAVIAPLVLGATILMDSAPLTSTRCLTILEDEPVSVLYTTPTVVRGLIGEGAAQVRRFRPRALRLAACVGEPLSADAVEWGERVLGIPFRDTWWQTETGSIVLAHDPNARPQPGSMGKSMPGIELAVVRRVGDGVSLCQEAVPVEGELALRKSSLPDWKSLGGEAGALAQELDGWHLTGDIVRRDAEGYYWFLGRADEVINLAGRMVGPFEVESVLMSHPAVAEAGVVGAADPQLTEHVIAFVAVNPGFDPGPGLRRELLIYAAERLGSGLAPLDIRFAWQFPRTSSGKIIRRKLKMWLEEKTSGDITVGDAAAIRP
jgi:acetyl-CoA synthetase